MTEPAGRAWAGYLDAHRQRFRRELADLLRIPGIASLPAHAPDLDRAARWLADRLVAAGLEHVAVDRAGAQPIVYADWLHAPGRPTVLLYGHFDVVPAPPDGWTAPPFEPVERDGRLHARGAADSKGPLLSLVAALEALLATGGLPVNVKLLLDGQEEILSPDLADLLAAGRDRLACDLVVSTDGGRGATDPPQIVTGTRGICSFQVDVHGPSAPLHGALHGGAVQNPVEALVHLLASLRAPDGRVGVRGFYDDVQPLAPAERARIAAVPFDEAAYRADVGVPALHGEPGYTTLERLWVRPSMVVGTISDPGIGGVIQSRAHARVVFQIVPDQDPDRVVAQVLAHVAAHAPPGVRVECRPIRRAWPYVVDPDHPGNQAVRRVFAEASGREPLFVRQGAPVPVCALFLRLLDAYTVFAGWCRGDEPVHGPDEFLRLEDFDAGQHVYARLLEELGGRPG